MTALNSRELLQLYQSGEGDAAKALFDRYAARLIALVRSRLGPKLKRRIDAEEVVQSTYLSFFVRAKDGAYKLSQSGDLWRLLASISLNKLHGQIEKQTAAKRSISREESAEQAAALTTPEPSPAEVIAVVEMLGLAIGKLSLKERSVLALRLQGRTIQQISQETGIPERTARRLVSQARQEIERRLLANEDRVVSWRNLPAGPEAPQLYSDYVLEAQLGAGGMGRVFRAREKATGRLVAIKALRKSRLNDDRAVGRFIQEAQILKRLRHPNIVEVKGLGRFPGGGFFLVMDYVVGTDLQSRIEAGPLSPGEAVSMVKQVAEAVQHAHEQGVVHCDLKPANVLVDDQGRAYVTDFGFAYLIRGSGQSVENSFGGTAGYIAPEILELQGPPTPSADVYGLGMLLGVLITGKSPMELDLQLASNDGLAAILAICRRCLTPQPTLRYQSASEVVQALGDLPQNS